MNIIDNKKLKTEYEMLIGTLNNLINPIENSDNTIKMFLNTHSSHILPTKTNDFSYYDDLIEYYDTDYVNKKKREESIDTVLSENNLIKCNSSLYTINMGSISNISNVSDLSEFKKINNLKKVVIFEEYTNIYENIIKKKEFRMSDIIPRFLKKNQEQNIFLNGTKEDNYNIYNNIMNNKNNLTIMYGFKSWTKYKGIIGYYKNFLFYKKHKDSEIIIDILPSEMTLSNKYYRKFMKKLQEETVGKLCYIEKYNINYDIENSFADSQCNLTSANLYNILNRIIKQFESKLTL
jgi:hypothetical protein